MSTFINIFLAVWLLGAVGFFGHEFWVYKMRPEDWKNRNEGSTTMPDWQVWLVMCFWPFVFGAFALIAGGVYISTNVIVFFEAQSAAKKKG